MLEVEFWRGTAGFSSAGTFTTLRSVHCNLWDSNQLRRVLIVLSQYYTARFGMRYYVTQDCSNILMDVNYAAKPGMDLMAQLCFNTIKSNRVIRVEKSS